MGLLAGRRILLGVCGGISAYKAVETLRLFTKAGADVSVVMTRNATRFVGAATFRGLSSRPVITDLFDIPEGLSAEERRMPHLEPAETADLAVVAPATANTLAKLAHGIADNALTTTLLSVRCPVLVAPAMDVDMWLNPATQDNVRLLKSRGISFVGPVEGPLARLNTGPSRLAEPEDIFGAAECLIARSQLESDDLDLSHESLEGLRVLVTAGGTREAIDPVRYIGNRSSGKMGYAIARAAMGAGAAVALVSGPTSLEPPGGCEFVSVESASEMHDAVERRAKTSDVIVMAAAVADFRPEQSATHKIKKGTRESLEIKLTRTEDIARTLGENKPKDQVLVIFAAETQDLLENAKRKLHEKKADLIVANDVSHEGSGFGTDTNQVTLLYPDGRSEAMPLMSKAAVAQLIVSRIARLRAARRGR